MTRRPQVSGRALGLVAGLAGLALLSTGCGGGSASPSVASLGTPTSASSVAGHSTSSGAGSTRSATAYAACLTSHGIPATSPGGRGLEISNADPQSPQFQAAQAACRALLPGGGLKPLSAAQQVQRTKALVAFSACVRKHGVPTFPDPNPNSQFAYAQLGIKQLTSPLGKAAFKACQSLFPKLGPQLRLG
jgi:hypothetical protein